jgi:ribosomal-protein-alanine N-acetyltransferase
MDIRLLPYKKEFFDLFLIWRDQPASVQHNPLAPLDKETLIRRLQEEGSDFSDLKKFESYRWFIQYNEEIVGNVSVKNINHMMAYAELGYGVDEKYHGKGIATAAVKLVVEKAFTESPLRKLFAYVHDKNIPSCRVLEKLGFHKEGLLREHYIINGKPENEVFYGLLKSEWRN